MHNNSKSISALLIFFMLSLSSINAQNSKVEKANRMYDKFAFVEAAKLYTELVNKGNNSLEVYKNLGDCYFYNGNYSSAVQWYSKIADRGDNLDNEYYFRYAQSLGSIKKYDEAAGIMKLYYSKTAKKDLSENWKEANLIAGLAKQSGRYNFKAVEINTPLSDFGTAVYNKDKAIYASARDSGVVIKRVHKWNEKPYLKLYTADIGADGELKNSKVIKGEVNSKYHQSTPTITKDGKTMYFTRSSEVAGKDETIYLKIFSAENINGEWKNIRELPFPINSNGFSSAHPALSADETELFFASDRNNKFGNSDLYVVSVKKDGRIGNDVKKLSEEINTLGRETYPFVDSSGILYFSSDGHPGLGGLDVFAVIKDEKGFYHVVNVGEGVNSTEDDFAYNIDFETKKGYFSSNRSGNDDIYRFIETRPVDFIVNTKPIVYGTIRDNKGIPLSNVVIEYYNTKGEKIKTFESDSEGKYVAELEPFQEYKLVSKKTDLIKKTEIVLPMKPFEKKEMVTELINEKQIVVEDNIVDLEEGKDLSKLLRLKPIYFDVNGFNLRATSKIELDKIVQLMKDRPNILVQVNSYTDSRGKDDFNMKLSKNRAKTTVDYIIKTGVEPNRLSHEGFGETHLVNQCSNGVKCSEKEHEQNRRSEFIITWK